MSIKRTIKLLLDRAAARRVERDTKRALDKGTDPRKPKRNLGKIAGALKGLKAQALALGGALVAAFAVQRIKQYITTVLQAFGRQERAILRVNSALMNMGRFTKENSKFLQDHAAALQRITSAGDEAILEATATIGDLATELTIGELAKAQKAAIALADTFFDGNLSSAATLLAKTIGSSTNALSRYGVEINTAGSQAEKLAEIMELTDRLFLTSQRSATDLTGRTAQLSNSWGDLHEAVGRIIARGFGLTDRLVKMREFIDRVTVSLEKNKATIAGWGQFIIKTVGAAFESIRFVIRALFNFGQIIGSGFELAMLELQRHFAPAINKILRLIDKIPGINIPFRMNELTLEEFGAENRRLRDQLTRDVDDIADSVLDLGEAYRNVGRAALAAARGQVAFVESRPKADDDKPGGGAAGPSDADLVAAAILELETFARVERAKAMMAELVATSEASQELLQRRAGETAAGMTSAFDAFFAASASGFASSQDVWAAAGQAARDAGASIVEGLVAGRVEEQMAQGLAALASGIWPPNPAALLAAGKHFAAAALFRAIPGAIRGGGGGGSSGGFGGFGGAGGPIPRGALGSSVPSAQPLGPEINIFIDPLSPADPLFQRVVLGATQSAKERYGDNVTVNIHPRTGGR